MNQRLLLAMSIGIGLLATLVAVALWQSPPSRRSAQRAAVLEFIPTPLPSPTPTPKCARLLFGGDLMFDRHIREHAQRRGNYSFTVESLDPLLSSVDLIIANLEGPITTFSSRSLGSEVGSSNNYIFTFDPQIIPDILSRWPFLVSLGNNHLRNFGNEGLSQTYTFLERGSIAHFGYTDPDQASSSARFETINTIPIAFINYNQFVFGGRERALEDIRAATQSSDLVIVYAHWGEEYVPEVEYQRSLAHEFVDAGADLIIGSHPHVIQGHEEYEEKPIYYSLGNFVFDQYFEPAVMKGLLIKTTYCYFDEAEIASPTIIEQHIQLNPDGTTSLLRSEDKK